ncbi:hypothetical protein GCM10020358_40200 [Amorphoplanes nipponensis]|uniref:Uncharacterized protein n=1 Tax=Actinoplanes nipponensis TaxID=135950 RepID=A0A919JQN8_9ACTN|nr:hypothetical protein [Actinoplanes nipponensis]GIE53695.1 hypothetical protein Ani05nite_72290 [Actinoplanes nipponensis]
MTTTHMGAGTGVRWVAVSAAVFAVVMASLWFGHAPPRSAAAYARQGAETVGYLRSQTRTARLWVDAVASGSATHQAASVALREAEDDASATAARFAGWDPPAGSDAVRATVTALGDEVTRRLAELRIAANRGRWADLPGVARPLPDLAERLGAVADELTAASRS